MSDSVWPHSQQPTRLPHPWDSPGKNTGVGCHFPLQCMKVKLLSHVWLLANPWTTAYQAPPSMGFSRQEYWCGVPLPSLNSVTNYPELVQTSPVKGSVSHNSSHFRCHWQVPGAAYTPVCRLLLKGLPQPPLQGQQLSRVSHRTQRNTLFIIMGFLLFFFF